MPDAVINYLIRSYLRKERTLGLPTVWQFVDLTTRLSLHSRYYLTYECALIYGKSYVYWFSGEEGRGQSCNGSAPMGTQGILSGGLVLCEL